MEPMTGCLRTFALSPQSIYVIHLTYITACECSVDMRRETCDLMFFRFYLVKQYLVPNELLDGIHQTIFLEVCIAMAKE